MKSQPTSSLVQIKEIVDFEEELATAKSLPPGKCLLRQHEVSVRHS